MYCMCSPILIPRKGTGSVVFYKSETIYKGGELLPADIQQTNC